jgi:hypothetical protein
MKNGLTILFLLISIGTSAQKINQINADLKLSDSLTYQTEVRVYQHQNTTNFSSLFRMFKDKSKKWTVEFYKHYAKVPQIAELKVEKEELIAKNNLDSIYASLVRSYILDLPSQSEIRWKMVRRGSIEKIERTRNGKKRVTYELFNRSIHHTDGISYFIQSKDWKGAHEFAYSNPFKYLEYYPDIDELNYVCEILNSIQLEFNIWDEP